MMLLISSGYVLFVKYNGLMLKSFQLSLYFPLFSLFLGYPIFIIILLMPETSDWYCLSSAHMLFIDSRVNYNLKKRRKRKGNFSLFELQKRECNGLKCIGIWVHNSILNVRTCTTFSQFEKTMCLCSM